jgi:hypothetical protein
LILIPLLLVLLLASVLVVLVAILLLGESLGRDSKQDSLRNSRPQTVIIRPVGYWPVPVITPQSKRPAYQPTTQEIMDLKETMRGMKAEEEIWKTQAAQCRIQKSSNSLGLL